MLYQLIIKTSQQLFYNLKEYHIFLHYFEDFFKFVHNSIDDLNYYFIQYSNCIRTPLISNRDHRKKFYFYMKIYLRKCLNFIG